MTDTSSTQPTTVTRLTSFLKKLGIIIGAGVVAALALALVFRQFNVFGISNFLFWVSLAVMAAGVWPVIAELGSGVAMAKRALVDKENMGQLVRAAAPQRDKWISHSVTYGLAGILLFILSLVIATVVVG